MLVSNFVDEIKTVGRKESFAPMWAQLRRKIDLEDPHNTETPAGQDQKGGKEPGHS